MRAAHDDPHQAKLDKTYLMKLHPTWHRNFIKCLEENWRQEEHEARQDRAFEKMLKEMEKRRDPKKRGRPANKS